MASIVIPVTKIKTMWLRRLAIAVTLPLFIGIRIAFAPVAIVIVALDALWCCGSDLTVMTRGAASAWRSAPTTSSKG